ncbi:hypothetical protein MRB53_037418 [Persea americana]|nr:hypothetical protein MRB53_037418 [Persea americana]
MEAFKAIEKDMKTKAFSKEGLSAAAKLDPKEKERAEMEEFLSDMMEELGRQLETVEADVEGLQVQAKKSKKDTSKAERLAQLEAQCEQYRWHLNRQDLLLRALRNDSVEPEAVRSREEEIRMYVENNQEVDFMPDDELYDEFNLDEEGGKFGIHHENDVGSSQDAQSAHDDTPEPSGVDLAKAKSKPPTEPAPATARRPSQHMKSPLPALATIATLPLVSTTIPSTTMKPAPPPKPLGEPLKYASAAAAAAASDKAGIGIASLPPPPTAVAQPSTAPAAPAAPPGLAQLRQETSQAPSVTSSPAVSVVQPVRTQSHMAESPQAAQAQQEKTSLPLRTRSPIPTSNDISSPASTAAQSTRPESTVPRTRDTSIARPIEPTRTTSKDRTAETNGVVLPFASNGQEAEADEDEPIYHLPSSLRELVEAFETVRKTAPPIQSPEHQRLLAQSVSTRPNATDSEKPRHYHPENVNLFAPPHYPQQPLPIFDDPELYSRVDADALFYSFYYRQGTYQQYLSAKALKLQSWRFHKQYQTWFQRHEEPKNITEDFEQGTYRFFDYESTW